MNITREAARILENWAEYIRKAEGNEKYLSVWFKEIRDDLQKFEEDYLQISVNQ